VERKKATQA
jgi:hypothetical protein